VAPLLPASTSTSRITITAARAPKAAMRTLRARRGGGPSGCGEAGGGVGAGGLGGTVVAIYLASVAAGDAGLEWSGIAAVEGLALTVGSGTWPRRATSLSHSAGVRPELEASAARACVAPSGAKEMSITPA